MQAIFIVAVLAAGFCWVMIACKAEGAGRVRC